MQGVCVSKKATVSLDLITVVVGSGGRALGFTLHLIKYVQIYERFLGRRHQLPSFHDAPCLCTTQTNAFIVHFGFRILAPH